MTTNTTTNTATTTTATPEDAIPSVVHLLDLATACVISTVKASRTIGQMQHDDDDDDDDNNKKGSKQNARRKPDGTWVTDADFLAQRIIVQTIHAVSPLIDILGEEDDEAIATITTTSETTTTNRNGCGDGSKQDDGMEDLRHRTRVELECIYQHHVTQQLDVLPDPLPLAAAENDNDNWKAFATTFATTTSSSTNNNNINNLQIEASRLRVIVDPLDGTRSYTQGDYDAVSILLCILLDDEPYFGVIGKPFGYSAAATASTAASTAAATTSTATSTSTTQHCPQNITPIRTSQCVTIYGGPLLQAAYIAGNGRILPVTTTTTTTTDTASSSNTTTTATTTTTTLPRAVLSSSRASSIPQINDVCHSLVQQNLLHPTLLHVSGAGEKSLRLLLSQHSEALWLFPVPGTCRWDVAAADALLRVLGGKLTNRYGQSLQYQTVQTRDQAENVDGIVACRYVELHATCIRLLAEWDVAAVATAAVATAAQQKQQQQDE